MKQFHILAAVGTFICALFATSAHATTVTLTPADCADLACEFGNETSTNEIVDIINGLHPPGLIELYKADQVDGVTPTPDTDESGAFAGSYSTSFANAQDDPADAWISYDGGASITCPTCFVLVKDGNAEPAWYLFDISSLNWDGVMDLHLEGFWPDQGAISHVAIYSPIPVPAAVWLFGSGLLGLVGIARRKKA